MDWESNVYASPYRRWKHRIVGLVCAYSSVPTRFQLHANHRLSSWLDATIESERILSFFINTLFEDSWLFIREILRSVFSKPDKVFPTFPRNPEDLQLSSRRGRSLHSILVFDTQDAARNSIITTVLTITRLRHDGMQHITWNRHSENIYNNKWSMIESI